MQNNELKAALYGLADAAGELIETMAGATNWVSCVDRMPTDADISRNGGTRFLVVEEIRIYCDGKEYPLHINHSVHIVPFADGKFWPKHIHLDNDCRQEEEVLFWKYLPKMPLDITKDYLIAKRTEFEEE